VGETEGDQVMIMTARTRSARESVEPKHGALRAAAIGMGVWPVKNLACSEHSTAATWPRRAE